METRQIKWFHFWLQQGLTQEEQFLQLLQFEERVRILGVEVLARLVSLSVHHRFVEWRSQDEGHGKNGHQQNLIK